MRGKFHSTPFPCCFICKETITNAEEQYKPCVSKTSAAHLCAGMRHREQQVRLPAHTAIQARLCIGKQHGTAPVINRILRSLCPHLVQVRGTLGLLQVPNFHEQPELIKCALGTQLLVTLALVMI